MNVLKNKVQLIGNLGKDPEIKTFEGGKKLAKMSIATSDKYKNTKGEYITETLWHNLVLWGGLAGVAEKFLQKGTEVAIEGKLVSRNYTGKDGIKRYFTEVQVNEMLILNRAKND